MRAGLLACWLLVFVSEAWAHRLDEYLQATRVAVATDRIDVAIDLTAGVAVADQVLAVIDADRNGLLSEDERRAYAQRILSETPVKVDERVIDLLLMDAAFPTLAEIRSGVGVIRLNAAAPVAQLAAGRHTLSLTHGHLPAISVYLVNALVPKESVIQITKQTRDKLQKDYRLEFRVSPR